MTGGTGLRGLAISLSLASVLAPAAALADAVSDFYAGKQVRFIIRSGVGGGYDSYARLLGRHMGRHIPGAPQIVPINMPGGGGIIAANHVAIAAPKDGSILTMVSQGLPVDQALGLNTTLKADLRTFNWIGNMSAANQVLAVWHTSKTKTIEDARQRETLIGSTGAGSISTQLPALLNNVLGAKFKIVVGYPDGRDVNLAMERQEVEGRGANPWVSYKSTTPKQVADKHIVPLVQVGLERDPEMSAPLLRELPVSAQNKPVVEFYSKAVMVGRPVATTPEAPKDRVAALRRAFDATLRDPEFLKDAEAQRAEIDYMSGEDLQRIIAELIGAPEDVRLRVRNAIRPEADAMTKLPGAKDSND
jgi:tripartite-type tricarboxylate transporter receptor subunit TctC